MLDMFQILSNTRCENTAVLNTFSSRRVGGYQTFWTYWVNLAVLLTLAVNNNITGYLWLTVCRNAIAKSTTIIFGAILYIYSVSSDEKFFEFLEFVVRLIWLVLLFTLCLQTDR